MCGFGPVYCERPPVLRGACGSSGCPFFTVLGTVTPREEVPAGCNLLSSSSLQSQTVCHRKEEGKSAWDGLCHAWRLSWLRLFPAPHHSIYRMGVKVYGVRLSGWAREGKKTFASGADRAPPCSSRVSCLAWSSLEGGGEVIDGAEPMNPFFLIHLACGLGHGPLPVPNV